MHEEDFFRSIYELIEVPIFHIYIDPSGDFVFSGLNPACEKITGLCKKDVVGKRLEEIAGLSKESSAALRANCQRCLEVDDVIHCEEQFFGSDQGTWWLTQLAPVRDEAGKIVQIIGSSTNIAQPRKTEQELRARERQYRTLVENLPDLIVRYDRELSRTYVNPAWEEASGLAAEEVVNVPVSNIPRVPRPTVETYIAALHRVLETGVPESQKFTWINARGELLHLEYRVIPEYGPDGNVAGLLSVGHDITKHEQAKKELQHSHDLLRAIIEAAPTAIIGLDLDGNVHTVWNPAAENMLGWSAQEAMGHPLPSVPVEKQEEFSGFREKIRRGETLDGVEVSRQRRDSTPIDYSIYASPLHDVEGRIIGNVAVLVDITERKRIDNIMQARLRLLELANSYSMDELLTATLDEMEALTGSSIGFYHFLEADQKTLSLQNWSTNTLKNMCTAAGKGTHYDIAQAGVWVDCVHERRAVIHNDYASLPHRKGMPEGHASVVREVVVPIFRGNQIKAIIGIGNKPTNYDANDVEIVSQLGDLSWDIIERKMAEEDLKESEEKYRLLITNADEAIFIVQDEVVKFPNPKTLKMIGYSAKELVKIPFINLVYPEEKALVREWYLKLLKSDRSPEAIPFRIVDRKGKEIWVNLTSAKIIWERKPGILCFLRDITVEKKLEAQFMQAQKLEAVGRLAGGVAHDFNNMLVVILGHAELALQKVSKSDPLHARLQTIHKAAQRSADLTRQLLAFARKQTITPHVLNLNDTVSGMINILHRLIGEDIDLVWIPGEDLWSIRIDPSQIDQVLANLCINARDAITGVGKVILETSNIVLDETYCAEHTGFVPGDYVLLTISDNGIGMDKETLTYLFEPFFTTKEVGKGTGLGLAMVYGIIKQNEGFINVYSELGQGSTFKLYFPCHMSKTAKYVEEKAAEKPHGGSETVLIVEDEKEILAISKNILEELGYMVVTARTPGEAIRLVGKYSGEIHLMITDVVMPEMNGRDLAEKLTSIKSGLKCLYMSGYSANIIAHRGVLEEGVHFIQKPFSTKDLAVKVRKVLDQV